MPCASGSPGSALSPKPGARALGATRSPALFARCRGAPILVLASHPGANAEEAFAAWRIARVRSADRRHGPKGTADHWRPSRYRASAHARMAARVRQPRDARWLRLSPSDAGRMTNRPRRIGRAANWDSNTVLLYPAKF